MEENRTWLSVNLFMDIVEYSTRSVASQISIKNHFTQLVTQEIKGWDPESVIKLDTGDGIAICYLGDPEDVLHAAIRLREAFAKISAADPATYKVRYQVRMGINLGPIKIIKDINGQLNAVGDGINVAQRIMSFATPGRLFASGSYFDMVSRLSDEYTKTFRPLGLMADKHSRKHLIYEIVDPNAPATAEPEPIVDGKILLPLDGSPEAAAAAAAQIAVAAAAPEALPSEAGLPPPMRPTAAAAAPAAVASSEALQPGLIIHKTLRLDARIAREDIAEVWRGLNTASGTPVVFKFIRRELAGDETFLQHFRAGAEALTKVQDPAVARCFGCYQDEAGRLFLLSEYINGMSLADRMKFGPMSPDQVMNLRDLLVRGLSAAHERGVVHRGLSPYTIILAGGRLDEAKIINFGIGKEFAASAPGAGAAKSAEKSFYLAPEQLGLFGGKVDERTDIYSLGLILAAAAGGTPVDTAGLPPATLFERRKEMPRIDEVPAELRGGLTAMLQPDPASRPRSMAELLAPQKPGPTKAPSPSPRPAEAARPQAERTPPPAAAAAAPSKAKAAPDLRAVRAALAGNALLRWPYGAIAAGALLLLVGGGIVVAERAQIFGGAPSKVAAGPASGTEAQSAAPAAEKPAPASPATEAASEPAAPSANPRAAAEAKPEAAPPTTAAPEATQPAPQPAAAPEETKPQAPAAFVAPAAAPPPPPAAEEAKPPPAAAAPETAPPSAAPPPAVAAPKPAPLPVAPAPAAAPAPPSPKPPPSEAQAKPAPPAAAPAAEPSSKPPSGNAAPAPAHEAVAALQPPPTQASLRERVQSVLQPLQCKSLRAGVSGDGTVDIDGFVSSPGDLEALPVRLAALGGVSKLNLRVTVRKWPFCAVLALLQDEAVIPGSAKGPLKIVPNHSSLAYHDGDSLEFIVDAAGSAKGYLYVDVVDPEGNVLHLFPSEDKGDNRISSGARRKFGSILANGKPELLISPPAGDLLIVAMLSPEPLFAALRPDVEPTNDFVAALKAALEKMHRTRPDAPLIVETSTLHTFD